MKQAQEMQAKVAELRAELDNIEIAGASGGGMVTVTLNGKGEMRRVQLDRSLIDRNEAEVLEDLIVAAHNEAKGKLEARMSEEMGKLTGGLGLPDGFKLPF
jgi:DNA-binding YbaB/EbfC family protein